MYIYNICCQLQYQLNGIAIRQLCIFMIFLVFMVHVYEYSNQNMLIIVCKTYILK